MANKFQQERKQSESESLTGECRAKKSRDREFWQFVFLVLVCSKDVLVKQMF